MINWTVRLLAASLVASSALSAQHPNARHGFWIGLGAGSGSVSTDCSPCATDRPTALTFNFRLGGTISPHFLLGIETVVWSGEDGTLDLRAVTTSWYPSAAGAFFLKGSIGQFSYGTIVIPNFIDADGAAGIVGVGYDIRLARNFSITPTLSALASAPTHYTINDVRATSGDSFRVRLFQFTLVLNWH